MVSSFPVMIRTAALMLLSFGLVAVIAEISAPASAAERGVSVRVRVSETDDGAAATKTVTLYQESHALVIGAGDYAPPWPARPGAVAAAERVADALSSRGFTVTRVLNPTARLMKESLETFFIIKGQNPDARLFVWFSGHGHNIGEEGFLVPVDAPAAAAGPRFKLRALAMRRFGEYVRLARSKHVMAVFDAFFETDIFDSRRAAPPPAITRATTQPARQFLTAGVSGQATGDDAHFTELFLTGMRGGDTADANRDGYVTASELGLYVSNGVTNASAGRLTPRFGSLRDPDYDRGDFVFAAADAAAEPPAPPPTTRPSATADPAMAGASVMIEFWRSIKDGNNLADFELFLESFPNSPFAALARNRIKILAGGQAPGNQSEGPPGPASGAVGDIAMAPPPASVTRPPRRPQPAAPSVVSRTSLVLSRPDADGEIMGKVLPDTKIAVTGHSGDGRWVRVRLANGTIGFIPKRAVRVAAQATAVPGSAPPGDSTAPDPSAPDPNAIAAQPDQAAQDVSALIDRFPLNPKRERLYATGATAAYAEPREGAEKMADFSIYSPVEVIGKVVGMNWYAVVLRGKGTAYVPGWTLVSAP